MTIFTFYCSQSLTWCPLFYYLSCITIFKKWTHTKRHCLVKLGNIIYCIKIIFSYSKKSKHLCTVLLYSITWRLKKDSWLLVYLLWYKITSEQQQKKGSATLEYPWTATTIQREAKPIKLHMWKAQRRFRVTSTERWLQTFQSHLKASEFTISMLFAVFVM